MYTTDQNCIAAFAERSPWHLRQVGLFVQATIQQHFEQVPLVMQDYAVAGRDSKHLSTQKRRAYDALTAEAIGFYDDLATYNGESEYLLRRIVELPGFGIVKAGFLVQLLVGDIGCLDRHSLRAAGMDERGFNRTPASAEALNTRLHVYAQLCRSLGGAERLWDNWRAYVSILRPKSFPTPEHVSQWHCHCLGLDTILYGESPVSSQP